MNNSTQSQNIKSVFENQPTQQKLYPVPTDIKANIPTTPTDNGNWMTNLLPTVGSLLGSMTPLGMIGGGALGSAGGKILENALEGKGFNLGDTIGAAGEGAMGGVTGKILGKGLGAIGSKVASKAESTVPKLLQGQVTKGALDDATATYLAKNGITDVRQMAQIHPVVTGPNGALNKGVRSILDVAEGKGYSLDLSSLDSTGKVVGSTVKDALVSSGVPLDSEAASSITNYVQGQLQKAVGTSNITTIGANGATKNINILDPSTLHNISPNNALDISKSLDDLATKLSKSNSPYAREKVNALRSLSNTIKDNLYGAESSISRTGIPDFVRKQMADDLLPLKEINPQYYQAKMDIINNPNATIADLRAAQANEVRAAQALDATQGSQNGVGINAAAPIQNVIQGGVKGAALNAAANVVKTPSVNAGTAKLMSKMSGVLNNPTMQKLVRGGAAGPAQLVAHGADFAGPAGSESTLAMLQDPNASGSGNIMQDIMNSNSPQALLVKAALADRMFTMPGQTSDPLLDSQGVSDAMKTFQGLNTAQSQVSGLQKLFNEAGGAQGPIGGLLAQLTGAITGGPAQLYNKQREALQQSLAQQGITAPLPTLGMNQQAADAALAQVLQALRGAGGQSVLSQLQ